MRRPGTGFLVLLTLAVAAVPARFLIRRAGGGGSLAVLVTWAVGTPVAAARLFRWEE